MDTKTIEKIIEMLDARINLLEKEIEDCTSWNDLDFLQGHQVALKDFKEDLESLQ